MGRVIVVTFISIDGVIQSPLSPDEDREGGFEHGGWVLRYSDDTVDAFMQRATVGAAGMLLGRRTYEILLDAWARADESEPAVAAMNRMPKYVVSSSPVDLAWQNSHSIGGDLPRAVTDLKDRTDGDLVVFGAGTLVRGLAEHDLVDEYRLLLFPVVHGARPSGAPDARGSSPSAVRAWATWSSRVMSCATGSSSGSRPRGVRAAAVCPASCSRCTRGSYHQPP